MGTRAEAMTAKQFQAWLDSRGMTAYQAAPILGVTRQMAYRYAANGGVPMPIAKLIDMLDRHGIPRDWS
jgi:predicted XRE-type DNA-binding protein